MKLLLFIVYAGLFVGCASVHLTQSGAKVRLTYTEPKTCQKLGDVTASGTNGIKYPEELLAEAKLGLRNKAAEMGGNVVHVSSTISAQGNVTLDGVAYKCK